MLALKNNPSNSVFSSNTFSQSALDWFKRGYDIIPIIPGTKLPAVQWDPWLAELSIKSITAYWQKNPTYELGFIVGDNIIVLDADSPESVAALYDIEEASYIKPNLIIKTTRGVHHYFKRASDTVAKSEAHSTKRFPGRIDVKTGRALVILPPSTGKSIALNLSSNTDDLNEVGQGFIDAVTKHNGKNASRSTNPTSPTISRPAKSENGHLGLKALLAHIDADSGYDDWLKVLMGLFYYTGGSEEGFEIADAWSSTGSKYKSDKEIRTKWNSFDLAHPRPITIGTIMYMVEDGYEIYYAAENPFEVVAFEVTAETAGVTK